MKILTRLFVTFFIVVALFFFLGTSSFGQVGSFAQPLKFEPTDTITQLREKIEHNGYKFTVSHNWVYDMSQEEKERFFSRRPPKHANDDAVRTMGPLARHLGIALPASFDWRNANGGHSYIGPVRDQGNCGSCYAFGAAAAAEGAYNVTLNHYDSDAVNFSESFIMWCLGEYGPYSSHFSGCDGADYSYSELKALTNEGIAYEANFPYTINSPGSCTHWEDQVVTFQSWYRAPCSDIEAIKTAIMTYGPVDAAVYVDSAFEAYSSGIYEDTNTSCSGNPCSDTTTNHAISLVGWDDNDGEGYWILRNSWGPFWGEDGYMRIKYTSAAVACSVAYLVFQCDESRLVIQPESPQAGFVAVPSTPTLVRSAVSDECGGTTIGAQVTATFSNGDGSLTLYDDGNHDDGAAGDGVYANTWTAQNLQDPTVVTISASKTGYASASAAVTGSVGYAWIEAFEGGVVPPQGWTLLRTNNDETWQISTSFPHGGEYSAKIYYDEALNLQDEILLSPVLPSASSATLTFWSFGSIYWGVEFDNYNLEVWLVFGDWDGGSGGGDDVLLAVADNDWQISYVWAKTTVNLTSYLRAKPMRIAFRYVGVDGAEAGLDDIEVSFTPAPVGNRLDADFGASGLWSYDGETWAEISTADVEDMVYSAETSTLYVDFETGGLWKWDGSTWTNLSWGNPENMVASGSVLYVDFGAGGLWKWDGSAWTNLSWGNPENMVASGSVLYVDFGTGGLWKLDGSSWTNLSWGDPENMVASGSVLYVDFGTGGLWKWDGSIWTNLSWGDPENMVASGSVLYVDFGAGGLWKLDSATWTNLSWGNPENMVASGSMLYVDFGTGGLWKWDGATWTNLSWGNPENMVASGSMLYVDFGAGGLWKLDGAAWSNLSWGNPEKLLIED